jgi:Spy/CpxP family protein refolding chaperone
MTFALAVVAVSLSGIAWTRAQQAQPAGYTPTGIDEVLKAVRSDLQSQRADVMAKNLTLDASQAAKFWPLYEAYQKEQNAIMDAQLKDIQRYIESFDKLDDAGALALINKHLSRDSQMVALRQKWLGQFKTAIGAKQAARALQIDRRLSLVQQIQFASKIPLIE